MNKAFEKIINCIKELADYNGDAYIDSADIIEIVQEVAEEFAADTNVGTNNWIACSERLPEEPFGCLVTVIDCEPVTQTDFENILPYFVGYDGEGWNDEDGNEIPFEVIAWQPLPSPFREIEIGVIE